MTDTISVLNSETLSFTVTVGMLSSLNLVGYFNFLTGSNLCFEGTISTTFGNYLLPTKESLSCAGFNKKSSSSVGSSCYFKPWTIDDLSDRISIF